MITRKEIVDFFNKEAEVAKLNWESLMKLSIEDRVAKRKAINDVFLDKESLDDSDENYRRLRLNINKNLSDFKEGDPVVLHTDGVQDIKCTISNFEGDSSIIVEVFPPNLPNSLEPYYDVPLVLDKDIVDLRPSVYNNFTSIISSEEAYWHKSLINTKAKPKFENITECEVELEETCSAMGISLLPSQKEAIVKSMAAKDYYMIQGPPGTGKSFVLSLIILEEIGHFNHKVVIIGPNHMAVNNTLIQVSKTCPPYTSAICKVGQSYNAPIFKINHNDEEYSIVNIPRLNTQYVREMNSGWAIGMTPHSLYTSRARDLECDTLIIDEAGQMTIPLALMGMVKAKKVIFAGDYKQLPPIISTVEIKEELTKSVFKHLVTNDNCTMLDYTFRMCEPICKFVSELFYDGKVRSIKETCSDKVICKDNLYSFDSPVILLNVDDCGKQTSDSEAAAITKIIAEYINNYGIDATEVGVLSPFRAQCANIRRHIRKCLSINEETRKQIIVDTIDKMQGQEREVIIISMTAGDVDYMTEMADFLYSPNKLNVAFSRAKSKLIIVGNHSLLCNIKGNHQPLISQLLNSSHASIVQYNEYYV